MSGAAGGGREHGDGGQLSSPAAIQIQSKPSEPIVLARQREGRIGRMADELMPMAVWYRQPKGAFYCVVIEGWRAA